jgi:hypothetical protein
MKWNKIKYKMWNANVVYRTEVYRISIYVLLLIMTIIKSFSKEKMYLDMILSINIYMQHIWWSSKNIIIYDKKWKKKKKKKKRRFQNEYWFYFIVLNIITKKVYDKKWHVIKWSYLIFLNTKTKLSSYRKE